MGGGSGDADSLGLGRARCGDCARGTIVLIVRIFRETSPAGSRIGVSGALSGRVGSVASSVFR